MAKTLVYLLLFGCTFVGCARHRVTPANVLQCVAGRAGALRPVKDIFFEDSVGLSDCLNRSMLVVVDFPSANCEAELVNTATEITTSVSAFLFGYRAYKQTRAFVDANPPVDVEPTLHTAWRDSYRSGQLLASREYASIRE